MLPSKAWIIHVNEQNSASLPTVRTYMCLCKTVPTLIFGSLWCHLLVIILQLFKRHGHDLRYEIWIHFCKNRSKVILLVYKNKCVYQMFLIVPRKRKYFHAECKQEHVTSSRTTNTRLTKTLNMSLLKKGGGATEMSDCFVKNRARLGCMQKINQELEDGWSSD